MSTEVSSCGPDAKLMQAEAVGAPRQSEGETAAS